MRLISTFFCLCIVFSQPAFGQTPSATTSIVTVSPAIVRVGGSSTISIQLRDVSGINSLIGTASLTIAATTASGSATGTVGTLTHAGGGSYTAPFTAGSNTGRVIITPSINGVAFTNTIEISIVNVLYLPFSPGGSVTSDNLATGSGLTLNFGLFAEYLVVGGGGAGGGAGGGGGAGEFLEGSEVVFNGVANTIVVGNGGQSNAANGGDSRFNAAIAKGGGGGGGAGSAGRSGGSGGGGGRAADGGDDGLGNIGGASVKWLSGFGNSGGRARGFDVTNGMRAGGGGGAGAAGESVASGVFIAGDGGTGKQSSITGTAVFYAAGGGGGSAVGATPGQGGQGGGGAGGDGSQNGVDGTSNRGSGGGGGGIGSPNGAGGKGGSGVVLVRYPGSADLADGGTESSITVNGQPYRLHSFSTVGSSSLTFNFTNFDFSTYASEVSSVISGSGPLTISSAGILKLTGNNTYTGSTTISAGTVHIGDGGTIGNLGSGAIDNNGSLAFNRSNTLTVGNAISGSGSVLQIGSGTTTLTGANSYTGTTVVNAGTLLINGNQSSASGSVTVASGAKLGGTGTVGGAVTVQSGGQLTPGTSPGIFTASNGLQLSAGSTFEWELIANDATAADRGVDFDGVNVTGGTLTIEDGVTSNLVFTTGVNFTDAFWRSDRRWLVFSNASVPILSAPGIFGDITVSADAGGRILTNQTGLGGARFFWTVDGNDVYLNYESGYPSATTSLVYTDLFSIPVNSGIVANLTVQLKDANENNLTYSGGTLTFTATSGTISSIVNNNDGTYTAVFNPGSTPVSTVTITPSINGVAFTNTTQISIVNELSLPSSPSGLTSSGNLSTGSGLTLNLGLGAEYLVIGGGGAGGGGGGGGGAGEFLEGSQVVFSGVVNTIVVGNGGQTNSANGGDSRFNSAVAKGGGGGGNAGSAGKSGGSGGGGGRGSTSGFNVLGRIGGSSVRSLAGFGNSGGQARGFLGVTEMRAGGGGGAGAAGQSVASGDASAGNGGIGRQSSITGTAVLYAAGGGGGSARDVGSAGLGGQGGGGNGSRGTSSPGADGTSNTGSGGGGGGTGISGGAAGGKGGSGVVLVRYQGSADLADGGTESSITVNGQSYRLHRFNTVGSSSLTFNFANFDFSTYSSDVSGVISGSGPLTFNSTGRLKLTGNNTYSGSTTISTGTLQIGDGGTIGNLGSGAVTNNGVLAFNRSDAITSSQAISGTGSLSQIGAGLLTLSSSSYSYTGSTSVSAGHLRVNSSITSSSGVTVASGAILSGTGTLPRTTISGTHAPGTSPGVQTISGDLTYNTGATFQWELTANDATATDRGTDFDGVNVSGALTIQTGVTSSLVFNGMGSAVDWTDPFWSSNRSWLVFDNANTPAVSGDIFGTVSVSADKNGLALTSAPGRSSARFFWSQVGNDIFLNYSANAVLPVTWKHFTGKVVQEKVELTWATAAEWNNAHFDVERSADGQRFTAIGRVKAVAAPGSDNRYRFLDEQPLTGRNMYRLKQVDLDGKYAYSDLLTFQLSGLQQPRVWSDGQHWQVFIPGNQAVPLTLRMFDASGGMIREQTIYSGQTTLSVGHLPSGIYLIRITRGKSPLLTSRMHK